MSRDEIYALAQRMIHGCTNGFARALHYLKAVGVGLADALVVLFNGQAVQV
jgi:hypothetical protein